MKRIVLFFTALLLLSCKNAQPQIEKRENSTLILFYDQKYTSSEQLHKAFADYGAKVLYEYQNMKGFAIEIPYDKPMDKAKKHFSQLKGVLSVEEDQKMMINGQ